MNPSLKPMKIPHATSPNGEVRYWFKTQAVYYSEGNYHSFDGARSLYVDIRETRPEDFANLSVIPKPLAER